MDGPGGSGTPNEPADGLWPPGWTPATPSVGDESVSTASAASRAGDWTRLRIPLGVLALLAGISGLLGLTVLPYYPVKFSPGGSSVLDVAPARQIAYLIQGPVLVLALGVALLIDRWWRPTAGVLLATVPFWFNGALSSVVEPRLGQTVGILAYAVTGFLVLPVLVGVGLVWSTTTARSTTPRSNGPDLGGLVSMAAAALLVVSWTRAAFEVTFPSEQVIGTGQVLRGQGRGESAVQFATTFPAPAFVILVLLAVALLRSAPQLDDVGRKILWSAMAGGLVLQLVLRFANVSSVPAGNRSVDTTVPTASVMLLLATAAAFVAAAWAADATSSDQGHTGGSGPGVDATSDDVAWAGSAPTGPLTVELPPHP